MNKMKLRQEKNWHKDTFNKDPQLLIEYEEIEWQKKREKDMLERGEYKDRNALRYGQKISP